VRRFLDARADRAAGRARAKRPEWAGAVVLVWCPLQMLLLAHSERGTEHFFPRPLTQSEGRGKNVEGRGAGFRLRDAKPRRSAEAGQDSFPWPTTPIAASQPMNEMG
jgi:hypothetical protein